MPRTAYAAQGQNGSEINVEPPHIEVVVVDDASTDGTRELLLNLDDPRVRVLLHAENQGKGAALRLGFAATSNPYVFVQDADLEYDPQDYHVMIAPLLYGRADMGTGHSRSRRSTPSTLLLALCG